uniref:Starch synthase catalytic domain-containing protein n=1 Tax=Nelumbo nucifera TaxID=4432 RepID=A0A822XQN9_NELNU|nr:TPA_asm: hypothetical protein HUJ06_022934 [Nelumbo nucifera]
MNIILVPVECAPWSKTGGLGDVAGALPKALARRGHRVMVVAPRYGNYAEVQETGVYKRYKVDGQDMEVTFFQAYINGMDFVFMDSPMFRNIEKNIYGGGREDILKRMVLFCKAALEVLFCKYTRCVLVIHNIAHPGGGEHFNIFAAGLKAANRVVTTSKPQCKAALQRELGLPLQENVPLIGFIGRLDQQKGVDLIAESIPWMVDRDVQLVMLGTGRPDLEQLLRHFESQHHDKVRGWIGFSVEMAHRITAGADILLMPSRFEPCGLNQLYALSYGIVPVVHAVGGLRDSVQPFDPLAEFQATYPEFELEDKLVVQEGCNVTDTEAIDTLVGEHNQQCVPPRTAAAQQHALPDSALH